MKPYRIQLIRLAMVGAVWGFLAHTGSADSWGPPTTEHWSNNRQYVLKVGWPFAKKLTLCKMTPTGKKEELWSRPYVDETWPPHMAYVADDGQHVVLRDLYHNLGYGKVLVFLGPQGKVLRSYELADLLTQDQILRTLHSVSSIWWSNAGWFAFLKGKQQFALLTYHGVMDCFDLATGERVALDAKNRSEIQACALAKILPLLDDKKPENRSKGAILCGVLKAPEAVPKLQELLVDETAHYGRARVNAAHALTSILSIQAIPLIEEQLAHAAPEIRSGLLGAVAGLDSEWHGVIKTPNSAQLLATWHRLSHSSFSDVRDFAVRAIIDRDRAQYVYDNPALLESPDKEVRFRAVCCLVNRGDKRAIPLLRTALQDSYSPTQVWAFRGLVKYQPEDILDIIHWGTKHDDNSIRAEAILELVRRGDKEATAWFVERIAALKDHKHDPKGMGTEHIYTDEWCEFIIEIKLSAAVPALRQAYTNKCEKIRRPVSAALAAFGDQDALLQLRIFAQTGDALDRSYSIKMLGLVGDMESLQVLREALADREPWVREAAKDAIANLDKKAAEPRPTDSENN